MNSDYEAITSPALLTEQQQLRVDVIHTLALWCGYDTIEVKQLARFDTDVDAGFVKSRLMQYLSEDNFDSIRVTDLQIVSPCLIYDVL